MPRTSLWGHVFPVVLTAAHHASLATGVPAPPPCPLPQPPPAFGVDQWVIRPPTCNPPRNVTLTFLLETVGCTVLSKKAGNRAAQPTSSSNPQPIPELPTEHVQGFKVVWSRKVPVERACAQK